MKSVGNLTDFVRSHMLEPFDVAPRIQALIAHFDDLNRAHQAVLKAQRQVELLTPLVADCDRHGALVRELDDLRRCREALQHVFRAPEAGTAATSASRNSTDERERLDGHVKRLEARRDRPASAGSATSTARSATTAAIGWNRSPPRSSARSRSVIGAGSGRSATSSLSPQRRAPCTGRGVVHGAAQVAGGTRRRRPGTATPMLENQEREHEFAFRKRP